MSPAVSAPLPSPRAPLSLRIAALFIILAGSTLGALTPVLLARRAQKPAQSQNAPRKTPLQAFLHFTKHFGSGVILGTAFIHLLAPAVEALDNPGRSGSWHAFPYALGLCLTSIMSVFLVEVASTRYSARKARKDERETRDDEHEDHIGGRIIGLAILEFGAILHSVLIGLTLAVDAKFKVLFVVLLVHQVFEGLGIGSRLATAAETLPERHAYLPIVGAVLFGLSTPLGLAAGLAATTSSAFAAGVDRVDADVVSGVLDALSAGILMYTALVELLGREILQNDQLVKGSGWKLAWALLWVFLGCSLMALLGKWA
ncbi:hypothetical protein HMN09_00227200 [Mycena chlorophos]|uniref:ZIP-like iron-zinc transporter n=1 Tax=Mycena chlorophos TaxID=658473 RepID=A0A8H6WHK7_MYCCL|nr:hypothetical protein HMN09_00227200 [Mycena chlorophos]